MSRVSIICSVHHESGNATAAELNWLLRRLRPEVIFLERSMEDLRAFLSGTCGTLESAAVMRYRQLERAELVPVDLYLSAAELKKKFDEMLAKIGAASRRYCELQRAYDDHTAVGGFAFLNSFTGALLQAEMQREMHSTVDALAEPRLVELYALWTHTNDLRERAMIRGVEDYSRSTVFDKGVLIVGAAHQRALYEKSRVPPGGQIFEVDWDFDWQHEVTNVAAQSDGGPALGQRKPDL